MRLDGAALALVRKALNAFCDFHNIPVVDDVALQAAEQLIKMVMIGDCRLDVLQGKIDEWFWSRNPKR